MSDMTAPCVTPLHIRMLMTIDLTVTPSGWGWNRLTN